MPNELLPDQVEVFRGRTLEAAMEAAVDALGSDLTVTGARKVRKGIPGLKANEHFEVPATPPGTDPPAAAVEALLGDAESVVDNAFAALLAQAEDEELAVSPAVRLPQPRTTPHPAPEVMVTPELAPACVLTPEPDHGASSEDVARDAALEPACVLTPEPDHRASSEDVARDAALEPACVLTPEPDHRASSEDVARDAALEQVAMAEAAEPAPTTRVADPPAVALKPPAPAPAKAARKPAAKAPAKRKPAAKATAKATATATAVRKPAAVKPPAKRVRAKATPKPAPKPRTPRHDEEIPAGWSRQALAALGVPQAVLAALPAKDPATDLAWVAALERALTRTVPGPRTLGAEAPCVLAAHGVEGVVRMIATSLETGLPVGVVTVDGGRVAPATATELALVLRAAVLGGQP